MTEPLQVQAIRDHVDSVKGQFLPEPVTAVVIWIPPSEYPGEGGEVLKTGNCVRLRFEAFGPTDGNLHAIYIDSNWFDQPPDFVTPLVESTLRMGVSALRQLIAGF